jgi:hypothetical protein
MAGNRMVAGTDVDLASTLGVADVSTVEAVKQLLLNAKTIAVPGSTSGSRVQPKW